MTLAKYRIQVMETLKACKDPAKAREFLAEVDLALMYSQISAHVQKMFCAAFKNDLDVLGQEAATLSDKQNATLSGVIVAAQAAISLYQLTIASDEEGLAGELTSAR
jgi:hypothetical protein